MMRKHKLSRIVVSLATIFLVATHAKAQGDSVPSPAKIALAGSLPAELGVKRARTGHLLVSPQVNGKDAGWFIFDTGAGMSCVDKKVVERLNLPDAGEASARGAGGTQSTRLRKIQSLQLGPVKIEDSTVVELDLSPIAAAMGEKIDGVIGYECFQAGVFEVDLENGKIVVHDPASYRLPDDQQWHRLSFHGRRPHVPGRLENHEEGTFLIDIGANSAITVNSPTVKKLNLLEARDTKASMSGGVGGLHTARSGTLEHLTICGQRIDNVPAIFSQAEKGALADDDVQGSVGVGLLRKFLLILNYKSASVALVPRG